MVWSQYTAWWKTFLLRGKPTCVRTPLTKQCLDWRTQIPGRGPTQSGAWLWSAVAPRWRTLIINSINWNQAQMLYITYTKLTAHTHCVVLFLFVCLLVMVLQWSRCAGHWLSESSCCSKARGLQPTIFHHIYGNQLQSVGRRGSLDPGWLCQHPAGLPCCLLRALC